MPDMLMTDKELLDRAMKQLDRSFDENRMEDRILAAQRSEAASLLVIARAFAPQYQTVEDAQKAGWQFAKDRPMNEVEGSAIPQYPDALPKPNTPRTFRKG